MSLTYIMTGSGLIQAAHNGRIVSIAKDHPKYDTLLTALRSRDEQTFLKYASVTLSVAAYMCGHVEIITGVVYYKGMPIYDVIADRILSMMRANVPHEPMVLFLNNIMNNPNPHSRKQLLYFLENNDLPITTDGYFLGWKAITKDWKDKHTGQIDNSIGAAPEMKREDGDTNYEEECGHGYHVGSLSYVRGFARLATGIVLFSSRLILVM